jgi:ABC-type uncharacterized transport system fused permease/ATPase subunit
MTSMAIATAVKLLETLPEAEQARVVDHLREYVKELQDEAAWDALLSDTQPQLIAAARLAKQQMAAGLAKPLDEDKL